MCLSLGQVAAELPLDSEEADKANKECKDTLLYIFGHGCVLPYALPPPEQVCLSLFFHHRNQFCMNGYPKNEKCFSFIRPWLKGSFPLIPAVKEHSFDILGFRILPDVFLECVIPKDILLALELFSVPLHSLVYIC
jgi:hypothetical protein